MAQIETYIPLYRKYRPQSFADLVGQEAIATTLGNAIHLSKVAHAYLFCGPRGTGKTSTARIFAKSLNCEQGPTITPCQTCASCVGITEGNALDVIEFDAASNNGVDDARELIESCQFAPMAGRFKIYIIDEVHMLTSQAFNALLKTLEEPPPNVVFIFATTEAHKVLPTIISRCQRFDFNRITLEGIAARLRYIAEQETIQIEAEALEVIARHARGGLRDAVGLLDQVAVLGRAKPEMLISRKDVAFLIGTLEEELLFRVVDHITHRNAADLVEDISQLVGRGIEPDQLLKELIHHFRNLLVVKAVGPTADPKALSMPVDYFRKLLPQAEAFATEELPQIVGRLAQTERNVRNTQQPQLWLEVGLIELAYREEIHLVQDLAQRVAKLEEALASGPVPAAPKPTAPQQAPPRPLPQPHNEPPRQAAASPQVATAPVEPGPVAPVVTVPVFASTEASLPASGSHQLATVWADLYSRVASPTTKSLMKQHTFLIGTDEIQVTLGCSSEPTLNLLKKPDKFLHLQKAIESYFGRPMKIELILEKNRPASAAALAQASEAPRALEPSRPMVTAPVSFSPQPVADPAPAAFASEPQVPERFEAPTAVLEEAPRPEPVLVAAGSMEPPEGVTTHLEALPLEGVSGISAELPEAAPLSPAESVEAEDLMEAKKFALEMLQGKLVE